MTTSRTDEGFRFEGWHMLVIMVTFFAIIAMVNVSMAVLANTKWTGLVVKNSYVASQKYNDLLLDAEHIRESGLVSVLEYSDGVISFELKNQLGKSVVIDQLTARIGRPAHEHLDSTLKFDASATGVHSHPVNLAPGIWAITITGVSGETAYRRDERIFVTEDGEGAIE